MGLVRRPLTHTNINFSDTNVPIAFTFYLKQYNGRGNSVLGFEADRIRTRISISTDIYHRMVMGKTVR